MTQQITNLCNQIQSAKDALSRAIFAEMDTVARRHHLDSMCFGLGTTLIRKGEEIQLKQIEKLDDVYSDYVNDGGFQALWTPDKGWY